VWFSLLIVALVGNSFVSWTARVGRDLDTSMLLRTIASPKTLNG